MSEGQDETPSPPREVPLKPAPGSYIVELDEAPDEKQTESGIIINVKSDHRISSGRVVSRAEGSETHRVGDRVYFSPYSGYELNIGAREFVQLSESEILGTFVEDVDVTVQ